MPDVIIITTGDELLYGTTVDTNSAFICSRFFGSEFRVKKHITVPDSIDDIISAVTDSLSDADMVITTGGLGPTDDDNTVEGICPILGIKPSVDAKHLDKMRTFFATMNIPLNGSDTKMVSLPEGSLVLDNSKGLAPGFVIEIKGRVLISLPGVPSEMEEMFSTELTAYFGKKYLSYGKNRLLFRLTGIRESEINGIVRSILSNYNVRWGITPKSGVCDLIVVPASDDFSFSSEIAAEIRKSMDSFLIKDGMESPEQELVYILKENHLTLATAESCTGGLLAKRITDIPGSSDVFSGSVVAYSNEIKVNILGVNSDTIEKYGAVSEETALEMARGIRRLSKADISVSITGIAGLGGGTELKPVGTVCFGFSICGREFTAKRLIPGSRERVRIFSSLYAINLLRKELKSWLF